MLVLALSAHVIVSCGLALAFPGLLHPARASGAWGTSLEHLFGRTDTYTEEVWEETREVSEVMYEHEEMDIPLPEPVLRDAAITNTIADGDDALPYEESLGEDGLSDASYQGPANNGLIGLSGGAGGAFGGRGGSRDYVTAGGGRSRQTWQRSDLVPHTSRVRVGDNEDLTFEGMHVSVHIEGFRARVLLDCFYRNDRGRDLEGRFQIRLPNEASPYYFAFGPLVRSAHLPALAPKDGFRMSMDTILQERAESWTQPKEARMVTRAKAARAYEEVSRRRVDPALLEWAGADIFSAHVSPLQAGRLHRVVLGYEVNLLETPCGPAYQLDLPQAIPDLLVDLHVGDPCALVAPKGSSLNGHRRYWNPPERRFSVRMPNRGAQMLRGKDEATGHYFGLRFRPDLPKQTAVPSSRAVFLVDVSASANPVGMGIWVALLEAVLEQNRSTLNEFAVAFFDVDVAWWRPGFTVNSAENVRALLRDARTRTLEGATDLATALTAAGSLDGAYDVFLLSDGAATWGEDDDALLETALGRSHPLFAYRTGLSGTDTKRLQALTRACGGGLFAVPGEAQVATAATAHTFRPWRIDAITIPGGRDLLVDGRPTEVYPDQDLLLVGRGRPAGPGLAVSLYISRGTEQRRIVTNVASVLDSELAPRLYGQVAVGQLEMLDAVPADVARAYATHFRVVGETCSLLMLETEADYERYGIVPADEAAVVKTREANAAVLRAHDAAASVSADPKGRFLRRLRSIQAAAGVAQALPARLDGLLPHLPTEAFEIHPVSLGTRAEALRTISSLVEKSPGDIALLRDIAFQAQAWGYGGHAYFLLRRAATLRPHQAQSLADLGACLAARTMNDAAILYYEAALQRSADGQPRATRRCTLFAYAHLLDGIDRGTRSAGLADYAAERLAALRHELGLEEADLVVTIGWNTDRTDVDLHVEEPSGEVCSYQNPSTKSGGRMTRDVTTGFGPETYVLRAAPEGTYDVSVHYFSSDSLRTSTGTRVWACVHRDWGRPGARVTRTSLLLEKSKERHAVVRVEVPPAPLAEQVGTVGAMVKR